MHRKHDLFRFLRFLSIGSIALLALLNCHKPTTLPTPMDSRPHTDTAPSAFFNFTMNGLDGRHVSFEQFRGKKVILLNVASECGYTPQYADWEKFYEANKEEVVVLGFPCNDFGAQEPGSATEIQSFCQKNYGVTFPMFEKVSVKGDAKAPLYRWLTDPQQNGWNSQEPSWNFCKYVVDEHGKLTHFFPSKVKPGDTEFLKAMGM